jgi:hypothetical protein
MRENVFFRFSWKILLLHFYSYFRKHENKDSPEEAYCFYIALQSGFPDGFFSNQKSQFWKILDGSRWKTVDILWPLGIFYRHLGYFMNIGIILCSFGTFFRFWCHVSRKIWPPWLQLVYTGNGQNVFLASFYLKLD